MGKREEEKIEEAKRYAKNGKKKKKRGKGGN